MDTGRDSGRLSLKPSSLDKRISDGVFLLLANDGFDYFSLKMPNYTIQGADGQQYGPVDAEKLQAWAREGRLIPSTRVFAHDTKQWVEAGALGFLTAAWLPPRIPGEGDAASGATARCAECGRHFSRDEMVHYGKLWVCATCKPVFFQKVKEGVDLVAHAQFGGFWIRVAAKIIDGLVMMIPILLVVGVMIYAMWGEFKTNSSGDMPLRFQILINVLQLMYILLYAAYDMWFVGRYGATLGKMACGLKVIVATGEKVSYARALGRHFAEMLSGLICYIGYLMVAFDETEKRALHDHICNTRVVKV